MKLSVAIITYNEEKNIARCLKSVQDLADEILVLDSYSSDSTEKICKEYKVNFVEHEFDGHIQQKNRAIDYCSHELILSLDADEALDDELKNSIRLIKSEAKFDGYQMNRLTYYCGHWVKHCGWYPDTKIRLFKKGKGSWQGINPHDKFTMHNQEQTPHLKGDILHYSYYTREDHLKQIDYFGAIAAEELNQRGKKSNYLLIAVKVLAQFFKSFILKLGFLDGMTGFTISRLSAFATYRKYHNLLKLNRGQELK